MHRLTVRGNGFVYAAGFYFFSPIDMVFLF